MSGTEAAPNTKSSFIHAGGVIEGIEFAGTEAGSFSVDAISIRARRPVATV